MLRLFLFIASVMAIGASAAEDVSPCPVDTVPVQILSGNNIDYSVAEISDNPPHFRAFAIAVTEHIAARLTKDKLCVNGIKDMEDVEDMEGMENENMHSAERAQRSLLQFVEWPLIMSGDYTVPVLPPPTGDTPPSCRIYSPWIDLVIDRGAVTQIRGIVRWNERQLLADQAVLAGAKNVPGMTMPLDSGDLSYFIDEIQRPPAAKPVEARVPPDLLWLLRSEVGRGRKRRSGDSFRTAGYFMYRATKNDAEGYTKVVLALIDRCFDSSASSRVDDYYSSILDIDDSILLELYRIPMRYLYD
jgi:hypothetical protein